MTQTRLVFGNQEHIDWVAQASAFRSDLRHLQHKPYRTARRKWRKPGKVCRFCGNHIIRGQMYERIGRQTYHDDCAAQRLRLCRSVMAALGFEVKHG